MPYHSISSLSLLPIPIRHHLSKHHSPYYQTTSNSLSIKSSLDNNKPPESKSNQGSWVSPDWLTSLTKSLTLSKDDDSNIPIASAKLEDVSELLGGALFLPLFKWMNIYGPIYRLAAGPRDFVVVSDRSWKENPKILNQQCY